jgi:hypothetical protein
MYYFSLAGYNHLANINNPQRRGYKKGEEHMKKLLTKVLCVLVASIMVLAIVPGASVYGADTISDPIIVTPFNDLPGDDTGNT